MVQPWSFNDDVAARFDDEALTHIPDYEYVIARSVAIARDIFTDMDARIIDVGSALGRTLEALRTAGFRNVYGVDNSAAMLRLSRVQDNLILADTFPSGSAPFDMVIANWTLHFIPTPEARRSYIADIFAALRPRGVFVLTDKIAAGEQAQRVYIDFKRSMGVSEAEIAAKTASLAGVLNPLPALWYEETLRAVGFKRISVEHDVYCFRTYVCHRDS